ncbi:MAG: HypC/HybG/HupF family hydrogenase formation chaperone [Candidatus Omnitrophica bacterium]|nr:HypC/HybG/HupF family hydrogenase formation chaperone [Candidatus Omnitrophota bacterium]
MCLAIPMKIVEIKGDRAIVSSSGLRREIGLQLLSGVKTGDYVVVHAGFAIERLDEERARETLAIMKEAGIK